MEQCSQRNLQKRRMSIISHWKDSFPTKDRYYETDNGILYKGDTNYILPKFEKDSVDAVITDPPYGIRKKDKWDDKNIFIKNIDNWIDLNYNITKGVVVWFCADIMLPHILVKHENKFHRLLIWNKPPGSQYSGACKSNIWYSSEFMVVLGKSIPKTNRHNYYGYSTFNYRTVPFKKFNHHTAKPIELMRDLVYFYSREGNIVFDPFSGTGTTLLACEEQGRKWIGIEEDEGHCKTTINRLEGKI